MSYNEKVTPMKGFIMNILMKLMKLVALSYVFVLASMIVVIVMTSMMIAVMQ